MSMKPVRCGSSARTLKYRESPGEESMVGSLFRCLMTPAVLAAVLLGPGGCGTGPEPGPRSTLPPADDGGNWPGYGRTGTQQHFSPLSEVQQRNVHSLGLAWSMDLPPANSATEPIAVDGVLYFAAGLSIVHAVDAATGRELWQYDPGVGEVGGLNLRTGWGVRGLAWWEGKIYVGTQDGRLIAIDAKTGSPVWAAQIFGAEEPGYISGAPRVFGDRVLIGFGSSTGASRGFVSAHDARTGALLWRFYTVPGDPSRPFENEAMAMAAQTWAGEWWKYGGGGHVWNAMAWDEASDSIYIGTGSPYPWNHQLRSAGKGDNLFISSIVALDGRSGSYKWHYQTTPGDTWDFDATMDIVLADVEIDGRLRHVLMQAPKNGFFYVIDRDTGKLISAQPFVKVNWATHVDLQSGRPVEVPGARYDQGKPVRITPTALGAHNWLPMAWSAHTGIVYIPAVDFAADYSEIDRPWQPTTDRTVDGGVNMAGGAAMGMQPATGRLLAWSPVTQQPLWQVEYPTYLNGGILATAGDLVFQGTVDGLFKAYAADSGKLLWQFDARAPLLAPPISYRAGGRQYVTVLTGLGMAYPLNAAALSGYGIERYGVDPRTQARRVLSFTIGGAATLPPRQEPPAPPEDADFSSDPAREMAGAIAYSAHCLNCHGVLVVAAGNGPDLRRSAMPLDRSTFDGVVRGGALTARGMPRFPEFTDEKLENIRQYIRAQAQLLRQPADPKTIRTPVKLGGV